MMPHCCIGVDVIVGFPGETEERFLETVSFLEQAEISYLHVFTYSERENTAAYDMEGVIPVEERRRRNKVLRALSDKKRQAFYQSHLGETRTVLVEQSKEEGRLTGYTDNYIKVSLPADAASLNNLVEVELSEQLSSGDVMAKPFVTT